MNPPYLCFQNRNRVTVDAVAAKTQGIFKLSN